VPSAFDDTSAGTLRRLAEAFRSGRLGPDLSAFALSKVADCPDALVRQLLELSNDRVPSLCIAALLDSHAETVETRHSRVAAELVWTGPVGPGAQSRDTSVVLRELFARAQRDVLVSTFVVWNAEKVFQPLAERMEAMPDLRARIFLHVGHKERDTTLESEVLREFSDHFRREWPGTRLPEVFYDPRGLAAEPSDRATWHAKCVVVDDEIALVTSANFTEWAQGRNVEAGVLVHGPQFCHQLRKQFESLVEAKQVRRVPGL
jgi:hypothetical protein